MGVVILGINVAMGAMPAASPTHHVAEILVATWAAHAVLRISAATKGRLAVATSAALKVLSAAKEATFAVRTMQRAVVKFVVLTERNAAIAGVSKI